MVDMNANDKTVANSIYRALTFLVRWGMLIFAGILFFSAFFFESFASDMEAQTVLFRRENILVQILILAVVMVCLTALRPFFYSVSKRRSRIFLGIFLGIEALLCIAFLFYGRCTAGADPYIVFSMAQSVANGDLSVIDPVNSYLAYYPHQIGLMTFYVPFIKAWNLLHIGLPVYHGLKLLNIASALLALGFGFFSLKKEDSTDGFLQFLFSLMFILFLPLVMYTSYVYGEALSVSCMYGAVYFLKRLTESHKIRYGVVLSIFAGLGTYLRKNTLIFVIAVLIVLVCEMLSKKVSGVKERAVIASVAILTLLLATLLTPLTIRIYEGLAGKTLPSGVTATSYFAMGMQDGGRGRGWYNGFNFTTYEQSGLDSDLANEVSRQAIKERLKYFKENPGEAASFYFEKHLSNWADGTYSSRQATINSDSRSLTAWRLYNADHALIYRAFCDGFQLILYFGFFLFAIEGVRRKEERLWVYIIPIAVFGTFLFHILWEANSRYVFPSALLLVPVSAAGLCSLAGRLFDRFVSHIRRNIREEK